MKSRKKNSHATVIGCFVHVFYHFMLEAYTRGQETDSFPNEPHQCRFWLGVTNNQSVFFFFLNKLRIIFQQLMLFAVSYYYCAVYYSQLNVSGEKNIPIKGRDFESEKKCTHNDFNNLNFSWPSGFRWTLKREKNVEKKIAIVGLNFMKIESKCQILYSFTLALETCFRPFPVQFFSSSINLFPCWAW